MQLAEIIPWGRSLAEYRLMFNLSEDDLAGIILGCGDGPASFNSELHADGGRVISVDPLYRFSAEQIKEQINKVYPVVMAQVTANVDDFLWTTIKNPEELGRTRMAAMKNFLHDYTTGKLQGRYLAAALPHLPFPEKPARLDHDRQQQPTIQIGHCGVARSQVLPLSNTLTTLHHISHPQHTKRNRHCRITRSEPRQHLSAKKFQLALCSHFLFLYSKQFSLNSHIAAILELCRVAEEVRIYPLYTLEGKPSPHVAPVVEMLTSNGYATEQIPVDYQFQKGADTMLAIQKYPT